MSTLEKAIGLAAKTRGTSRQSWTTLYLTSITTYASSGYFRTKIVAVMHDLLEDTDTTIVDLISLGFSQDIIDAVIALTKNPARADLQPQSEL